MPKLHPFMYAVTKVRAHTALRRAGFDPADYLITNDLVDAASTMDGVSIPPELHADTAVAVGAGGGIIAAVLAFFASATGQALIAALLKLLGIG